MTTRVVLLGARGAALAATPRAVRFHSDWLFLSIPKEGWNRNRLRFRVLYSSAAEDVQPIIFARNAFDTDFRESETMILTNEDTNGLEFRHWEDRPAHFH